MEHSELIAAFVNELEAEFPSSKKCVERIPESLFDYKPHPKSMNMGYLALLVAEIPSWITHMVEHGEIDFATYNHFQPKTTQDLVDHMDNNFQNAVKSLKNVSPERLEQSFVLKNNGQVLYSSPMIESLSSTINHWVHHRGQLTVYMRLNDIAVPSIYGPSADDKGF